MQKKSTEKLLIYFSFFYNNYVVSRKKDLKNIFPIKTQNLILQIIQNIHFPFFILEVNFAFPIFYTAS